MCDTLCLPVGQGWTLLAETCPECAFPVLRDKANQVRPGSHQRPKPTLALCQCSPITVRASDLTTTVPALAMSVPQCHCSACRKLVDLSAAPTPPSKSAMATTATAHVTLAAATPVPVPTPFPSASQQGQGTSSTSFQRLPVRRQGEGGPTNQSIPRGVKPRKAQSSSFSHIGRVVLWQHRGKPPAFPSPQPRMPYRWPWTSIRRLPIRLSTPSTR